MKHKISNVVLLLSSTFLLFSCADDAGQVSDKPFIEPDDIHYESNITRSLLRADTNSEEEEEEVIEVDKVILHYYNDDGACPTRAFYVWVPGVDGEEYSSKGDGDIVEYSSDGSLMTITIDFKNDSRFTALDGASSLMYIIKYQMISPSNLNWGGQSEDVELKYEDFAVEGSKTVEVWCTPAAGGGIAQFASEEETKVDGVKLAKFTDWKTISCTLTDGSYGKEVEWTLYAFDENYYKVKAKNRPSVKKNYAVLTGKATTTNFNIDLKYNAHINIVYSIESKCTDSTTGLIKTVFCSFENLYGTPRFEKYYTYKGNDLGVTYSPDQTTFKIWSPVAANITLYLYDSDTSATYDGDDKYKGWHMVYQPGGIWALTLKGDLNGKYYNFNVDTWIGSSVTMDPYATGAGACGVRGLIYDKEQSNPNNWSSLPTKWDGVEGYDIKTPQELTVYEVHIQDFTGDSSWISNKGNKNGTFNAFVEEGTRLTDSATGRTVTTGFDHLKELGFNTVQLMPVFDSDNDEVKNRKYNWGYNPLNYNCVEGMYSSNPHDGLVRIKEYKNLVLQCAANGIRVVMDVVYNHVSSPSASCFNKLMPRYFFRYDENGELYDGSGCHNEFKSEATMARKYIVDSVSMWAREYKIKGFRFDLMGLIDTHTMYEVKKALYEIDPDIYLYGEGWTSGGFHGGIDHDPAPAELQEFFPLQTEGTFCCNGLGDQVYSKLWNHGDECYLGGFNDLGRNAIKGGNDGGWGSTTHLPGWGFISQGKGDASANNRVAIEKMIYGAHGNSETTIGANPAQTVNYASCHDNWTLRDQLYYCLGDGTNPGNAYNIKDGVLTVESLIFASNGIAFMLGGEEILRTKDVDLASAAEIEDIPADSYETMYGHRVSHNSYNSPLIVNSFKWNNKFSVTIDGVPMNTYDLTSKFASLVSLHKKMPKYSYGELYEGDHPITSITTKGNYVLSASWAGDSECAIGIQFDEYFIFAGGRQFGYISCDSASIWGAPIYTAGTWNFDSVNKTVNVGDEFNGAGYACVIYNARGGRA